MLFQEQSKAMHDWLNRQQGLRKATPADVSAGLAQKDPRPVERQYKQLSETRLPIPEGNDSVGEFWMLQVRECVSGQTKVSQLEVPFIVDQQVGCLEITMDHTIDVAMCKPIAQLLHIQLNLHSI